MKSVIRFWIVAFCLWHMYAIAIYVIPSENNISFLKKIEQASIPAVRSYVFVTSQWQKWNIFSPDPIRRVSIYEVNIEQNGRWNRLISITPDSLPWHLKPKELKLTRQLEENNHGLISLYLKYICKTGKAPRGAHIKISSRSYVIPAGMELEKQGGWTKYKRDYRTTELGEHYCDTTL